MISRTFEKGLETVAIRRRFCYFYCVAKDDCAAKDLIREKSGKNILQCL